MGKSNKNNKTTNININSDCVFCKIVNGEIPAKKVYEDENVIAFLDIAEDYPNHTLVVPKSHYTNFVNCEKEALQNVMNAVKKISQGYISSGYTGVNVFINNGKDAGQSIDHFHVHIIPRKQSDGIVLF